MIIIQLAGNLGYEFCKGRRHLVIARWLGSNVRQRGQSVTLCASRLARRVFFRPEANKQMHLLQSELRPLRTACLVREARGAQQASAAQKRGWTKDSRRCWRRLRFYCGGRDDAAAWRQLSGHVGNKNELQFLQKLIVEVTHNRSTTAAIIASHSSCHEAATERAQQ